MKKTLITLATLASFGFANAATMVTDKYSTDDLTGDGIVELNHALDFGYDWSISFVVVVGDKNYNQWGTPVLASGSNPTADNFPGGFQVYNTASGDINLKLNFNWNGEIKDLTGESPISAGSALMIGITYDAETRTLAIADGMNFTEKTSTIAEGTAAITHLSSGAFCGDSAGWALYDFTVLTEALPVPEPATASLSLLGLAALMMRRRRA